jgi:glutathione S-transferase
LSVTLHGAAYSIYVRIARLALEEKGVAYQLNAVDIFAEDGPGAAHHARHPFGKIPALEHDGFALYETAAICRYVDEAFEGPPLQPADVRERTRMAQIIGLLDSYGYRSMVWSVYVELSGDAAQEGRTDRATVEAGLERSAVVLGELERLGDGPFLTGQALSLADLHAAPMLAYIMVPEEGRALVARYPRIAAWVEAMRQRPAVIATRPEEAGW